MLLIPSFKHRTKNALIKDLRDPEHFLLPLDVYKGKMTPIVQKGDAVLKYQKVAESTGIFASTLHSPASGKVLGIIELGTESYLKIENDFQETTMPTLPPEVDNLRPAALLNLVLQAGIEGSGGARFPTATKLAVGDRTIDYLLINAAECEPYLSADYALTRERSEEILQAILVVQRITKAKNVIFGIEKQNKDLLPALQSSAKHWNVDIRIKLLPDEYPQGGELQLIKSLTGREIAKGTVPADHGIIVQNIATLYALYQAFFAGQPYISRVVTVAGEGISHTGNYHVKIGTPIAHLLQATGNDQIDGEQQIVIQGGPMMGKAVEDLQRPIHKGTGGILVLSRHLPQQNNCISCGYCVDVCPQHLMPLEFVRHTQERNATALSAYHLQDCIECGACHYACPSDLPLMESIWIGKSILSGRTANS